MYDFVLTGNLSASVAYTGGWPALSVCSYRKRITTGEVSPVPWQIEGFYSDASCTTPYDGADSSRRPEWLFSITESGAGVPAATDNEVINTMVKPQRPTMIPNDLTLALRAKPEVGSMDAPVDLSMFRRKASMRAMRQLPSRMQAASFFGAGTSGSPPRPCPSSPCKTTGCQGRLPRRRAGMVPFPQRQPRLRAQERRPGLCAAQGLHPAFQSPMPSPDSPGSSIGMRCT